MKDKDEKVINGYRECLCLKLFTHLKRQGKTFVNENYYDIQTFIKLFLNNDFLKFLLQLGTTYNHDPKTILPVISRKDISTISYNTILKFEAHKNLPTSFRPFLFYFVRNNANIIETFVDFISKKKIQPIELPSLNHIFIDSRSHKTQLVAELVPRPWYKINGLSLQIFKNTKINNLVKFLNSKPVSSTITSLQSLHNSLPEYPHGKAGKVNYFQKIKEYLLENEKKRTKNKNKKMAIENRHDAIDYENEPLPDTDEQIAAKALGENKYYELKHLQAGVNILRQRRKRLKDKFKTP